MANKIIKYSIGLLVFVLGWVMWIKVVDRIDELLKQKLSKKAHSIIYIVLFIVFMGLFVAAIFYTGGVDR